MNLANIPIVGKILQPMIERTMFRSSYYPDSYKFPYNPDDLASLKGGLDVYKKMLNDEQVSSCLRIKQILLYGSGWEIMPGNETPEAKEQADFCNWVFSEGMKGSFKENIRDMLSSWHYGFSLTEKLPIVYDWGKYKGRMGYKQFKTRPPHSFEFNRDDYGNITSVTQNAAKGPINISSDELDKYFVLYTHNAEFDNPFGKSELRYAYRAWFSKDIIYRFRNIFLERFGMGMLEFRYPRGLGNEELTAIDTILDNIQTKSGYRIPKDIEVNIKEAARRGEAGFHEAMDREDKAIAKAMLIPDKLGFTESISGSYNLGENQFNLFFLLNDNARDLFAEAVMDEQVIPQLIDWNYSNVSDYPKFKFKALTQKDKKRFAELIIMAIDKGIVQQTEKDEEHIREQLEMPKKEGQVRERPKPELPPQFGKAANDEHKGDNEGDEDEISEEDMPTEEDIDKGEEISEEEQDVEMKQFAEEHVGGKWIITKGMTMYIREHNA